MKKKKILIILLVLLSNVAARAQQDTVIDDKYVYEPDKEAKEAVSKIVKYTGLIPNFNLIAGDVPTALAYIKGKKRYIAYNPDFILRIRNKTETDWGVVSVLAHEIAHHLLGHTLMPKRSSPGDELAADKFSGFILYQMGATLKEALAAIESISYKSDSLKYPPKEARKEAISNGWSQALSLVSTKAYNEDLNYAQADSVKPISLIYKCRFSDDDNLYFVDDMDRIIWFDNYGTPILIGHKRESLTNKYKWIYVYKKSIYGVDSKNKIWYETSPGMLNIIGKVELLKKLPAE